jgi:hypothetical protein
MMSRYKQEWMSILLIVFLAVFPPLTLFANNLGEVTLDSLWRPLVGSLIFGILIFGLALILSRDWFKASMMAGIFEILFFSYGHVYQVVKGLELFGLVIGRHRFLMPIFLLILVLAVWRIGWHWKRHDSLLQVALVVSLALTLWPIFRIISYELRTATTATSPQDVDEDITEVQGNQPRRDIYLIVLDGYVRSDYLRESVGFDNTDFTRALQEIDFYVAECSRSNYAYTLLSMTATLNMDYLDNLFENVDRDIYVQDPLRQNKVRQILADFGYQFVAFETFYPWLNITDADYFLKPEDVSTYNPFEILYLQTTMLAFPYDLFERQLAIRRWSPEHEDTTRFANLIQYIFNYLKQPSPMDAPIFVYAHIVSPHYPYVFNADGSVNYGWRLEKEEALRSTYAYLSSEVIEVVAAIMENSDQEPIIIIQADHGMSEDEAYKNLILNAYYLPEGDDGLLYPSITPVNTFRVVLNEYFGMNYPLLDDHSYYSTEEQRFNYWSVNEPYQECQLEDEK